MTKNADAAGKKDESKRGTVFRKTKGKYFVNADGRIIVCSISSTLRKHLVYPTADPSSIRPHVVSVEDIKVADPVAIGDVVSFIDAGDDSGMITEILPRKNTFSRCASGSKLLEQVIVANVDQVVAVFAAARPKPKWGMLDRYLANAESAGLPALICITKLDLAEGDLMREVRTYEKIGYPLVLTSALNGMGIDEFKEALIGRVSVLLGKSGVGKTTLLNVIQPGLGLRVNEISSSTGKGKHTTNWLEMFQLDFGGSVIDTPGMREFGFWRIFGEDIAGLFPEMRPYRDLCRFGADCSHTHEPGCAIKKAVELGHIVERRYHSYLRMRG